jgi:hypothetical protein
MLAAAYAAPPAEPLSPYAAERAFWEARIAHPRR